MAAVVTARGVASSKASGATLTISGVSLNAGSMLVVATGYDDAAGHPTSVAWGNRQLRSFPATQRNPAPYDIACSGWVIARVRDTATRNVVITWPSAIVERAAMATMIEGANRADEKSGNNDGTATTGPVTGVTATLDAADELALCYFISEGPDTNDTAGSAEISDGGTFTAATLGQRIGTNGAPPVSNVTVQEAYLQLSSATATEGRLVGATSRLWVSFIMTMSQLNDLRSGITPSDMISAEALTDAAGGNAGNLSYRFNDETGLWEAYETATPGTLRGVGNPTGWAAP